jgi:hypothetical protein
MARQRLMIREVSAAGTALLLALSAGACSAAPSATAAPPGPAARVLSSTDGGSPNINDAWSVLSQSSRVAASDTSDGADATDEPAGPQVMSPAAAQAAAPFQYAVPAWAPTGFALQPEVEVLAPPATDGYASVSLTWQNAAGATIALTISQDQAGLGLAGAGSDPQPVQIGSQLGSLSQLSGFAADRLLLYWTSGKLSYRLAADVGSATRDDLVRMAESVN